MTFACITPALIVGAFAERVRFWPLMLFVVLWLTVVYFPIAHMVWYWAGPDFLPTQPGDWGLLYGWGALDFAGGTVVHINAGIAGLVGCLVIGKRLGYNSEPLAPHSLVMTMIGASLLWVGWFGFNAGSNLEANGVTALAFINTFVATAAAALAWALIEQIVHRKSSLLGGVTGAVAGLVAITPAAGFGAPGTSIVLGAVASVVCFFFVAKVKNRFGYDNSLDVFGVHCVGGIVGRDRHRDRRGTVARRAGVLRLYRASRRARDLRHRRAAGHAGQGSRPDPGLVGRRLVPAVLRDRQDHRAAPGRRCGARRAGHHLARRTRL